MKLKTLLRKDREHGCIYRKLAVGYIIAILLIVLHAAGII